jgi:hypothetical protein
MKTNFLFGTILIILLGLSLSYADGGTLRSGGTRVWSGAINTDWYQSGNWIGSIVPSENDTIIIPSNLQRYPILSQSDSAACKGLTINDADYKNKTVAGGRMIVSGEFVVDGNLTIKGGGYLDITDGGALTINGNLKNLGSMVLENGGSLITTGTVNGTASIVKEIPSDLKWHFISSPVDYQEICNGSFAPLPSHFSTVPANTWDLYLWSADCPVDPLLRWRNLRTLDMQVNYTDFGTPPKFEVQKGYLASYGAGFSPTKTFIGTPNTGDQTFVFTDITHTCSWELVGNPYPSAFVWDSVKLKENLVSGYYYVWNENRTGSPGYEAYLNGIYHTDGVNGNIPPMQGFFIKVDPYGTKKLSVPNDSRVHDSNHWLKNGALTSNQLIISMGRTTTYDETYLIFGPDGTLGKDWFDAEKLFTMNDQMPQVYTIVDNDMKTLVNALPFTNAPLTVPLGIITPAQGNYDIKVKGFENFSSFPGLTLEDLKTNTSQNMVTNPVFSFYSEDNKEDAGRFLLHFSGPIGINDQHLGDLQVFSNGKNIIILSPTALKNASVVVTNLLGQQILNTRLADSSRNQLMLNCNEGYYIIQVRTESTVKTTKVYIN